LDVSQVDTLSQLSEEAFWSYARELVGTVPVADKRSAEQRPAMYVEYLECVTGKGDYLFPLAALHEVVLPPRHYTFLPGRPVWMAGLAAWRGVALAVIDLSLYLTGNAGNMYEPVFPTYLLIARDGDLSLGFLVHSTGDIIAASEILPVASDDALAAGDVSVYGPARNGIIAGRYADAVVLDVPALLADIVQQLAMATPYG
jgi:chemotaxis signal transduction protein